jgi:hypothetical protein
MSVSRSSQGRLVSSCPLRRFEILGDRAAVFRGCFASKAIVVDAGPELIRKASSMEMQLTGNGRRWSRRIAVDIPIQVAVDGSPIVHGHLKDLSLSGALVITDRPLPLRAYIEITFQPLETAHGAERVMARVTRNLEGGVGVEWCEFAPSAVTDLLRSPSY